MRNRAKCKLCESVLESMHREDYVECKCGEIAIDGGDWRFMVYARNFENMLRIDDSDKEIQITMENYREMISKEESVSSLKTPSKAEITEILDKMIKDIEGLPPHAMTAPVTHYDLLSVLLLFSSILRY